MLPESLAISAVEAEVLSAAQFFAVVLILSYAFRKTERWSSEASEPESDDVCACKRLEKFLGVSLCPKFPPMTSKDSGATTSAGVISTAGAVVRRIVGSFRVPGV